MLDLRHVVLLQLIVKYEQEHGRPPSRTTLIELFAEAIRDRNLYHLTAITAAAAYDLAFTQMREAGVLISRDQSSTRTYYNSTPLGRALVKTLPRNYENFTEFAIKGNRLIPQAKRQQAVI